ncbi:MAG TPA: PBP1A family penicillin-binding protein [Thermoanaerobaculia bacterium]|nr:PBP1A family penicillin-binding protein [Thermoanaerobaculia bacterium]
MDLRSKLPSRRTIIRTLWISTAVIGVMIIAFGIYLYRQSVGKFEIRRLSLPTRIYADYTPLRPQSPTHHDELIEKLERLGYRQTKTLEQSGDYVLPKDDIVDLYTRAFTHPSGQYTAQRVRMTFDDDDAIDTVTSIPEKKPVTDAALEPELLTSILSDQLENRRPVVLAQVPARLQDAVIVTEDIRFWYHPGVDPIGITRALFRNVRAGGVSEGASTLTQQLVKNYYLTSERTFKRKITEAFMAVILDSRYSKKEILEAYLNDIYLGRNRSISILGVGEAAHFYFGKPVSELSLAEAALLAGMIRSPNNYSPFTHPDKALERRNTVLALMVRNGKADQASYEQAVKEPLPKKPSRDRSGLVSIPFYVDRVLQEMVADYGIKDVKGRGLQIYTGIDLAAQDTAARTLEAGIHTIERNSRRIRTHDSPLQGVIIHVDVATGEIRALVGGRDYDKSQFNRALSAKRQVGSLFKPFVYLTAFEPSISNVKDRNITPASLVSDQRFVLQRRFGEDWSPRNYGDEYHGTVTLRRALEVSMNSASVRIGLAAGIDPVVRTAHTLGVDSPLDDNPAVLLGAAGIPPIEMAAAYSTIARLGSRMPLRAIRFVTDDRGKIVSSGEPVRPVQVYPARDVFLLISMMKGVMNRGTAAGARDLGFGLTAAGKTGTTNDERDAWFVGFTPHTLALTWIGFDDNTVVGLSGGHGAVPIWARYMAAVTAGQESVDFEVPQGIVFREIDETSGGLATHDCPPNTIVREAFKKEGVPTDACSIHGPHPTPLPQIDAFGNPIVLDTTGTSVTQTTDTTGTLPAPPAMTTAPPPTTTAPPAESAPPPAPQPPPAPTLTGGFGQPERTSTAPPPSTSTQPPQ